LLKSRDVAIAVMTPNTARAIGLVCARTGHNDVIDVHVAMCARERNHAVVSSDSGDLARIDPDLPLVKV
jgi:hypothetical protein